MNFPSTPELRDPQGLPPQQFEEEIFNLRAAVAAVLDAWPIAVGLAAAGIAMGLFKTWVTAPEYESSATIEIEARSSGFAVGPETFSQSQYWMPEQTGAQMEIIQSRSILGTAAEQIGLTVSVQPRYMGSI